MIQNRVGTLSNGLIALNIHHDGAHHMDLEIALNWFYIMFWKTAQMWLNRMQHFPGSEKGIFVVRLLSSPTYFQMSDFWDLGMDSK